MTEHAAANPNSAGVLYTIAKEELKKFEVGLENIQSLLALCPTQFTLKGQEGGELDV